MFFTTSDDAKLWYDDWNNNDNNQPVLVFLHGFTSYRISWGHQKNGAAWLLANQFGNYRCVFLETRGCNDSREAPGPYTIQQQAIDVIALADFLNIQTFTFCGHSMGGGTGFELAATVPERLHKLVLLAPVPSDGIQSMLNPDPTPPRKRTHVLHHTLYPSWTKEEYKQAVERFVVLDEGRPSSTMEFFRDRARMITEISQDYWIQSQESIGKLRLSDAMKKCEIPTLIIAGATDTLLLANVHDAFRMPDAVLHVSAISGHETALHDPIGVAGAIHSFMEGQTISQKKFRKSVNRKLKERGHLPIPPRPKM